MLKNYVHKVNQAVEMARLNPYLLSKLMCKRLVRLTPQWRRFVPPEKILLGGVCLPIPQYLAYQNLDYFKKICYGCFELPTSELIKKTLNPGDTFLDVGANIGYFTAMAAGQVTGSGRVISFEPVPQYFENLKSLKSGNPGYDIAVYNVAVGDEMGSKIIHVADQSYAGASTLVDKFLEGMNEREGLRIRTEDRSVEIVRLDAFLKTNGVDQVKLLKIDVEGYEIPVLKGLKGFFEETRVLPDIVCEITTHAYPLLGTSEDELIAYMEEFGYESFSILNPHVKVDIRTFEYGKAYDVVFRSRVPKS
jgi:FkbM family methyltransferase